MTISTIRNAAISVLLATALAASSCLCGVRYAQADEVTELTKKVEETAAAYKEAAAEVAELEERISENQTRILELKTLIDDQKDASNDAVRKLYIYQKSTSPLIDMVLTSTSVSDMFGTIEYMNRYEQSNLDIINERISMKNELEEKTAQLEADKASADEKRAQMEADLEAAQQARQAAMDAAEAAAAAELAAAQAEQAQAAAAAAEQSQAQSESQASDGSQESETVSEVPSGVTEAGDVDWTLSYEDFVNAWALRIDAYLAGSPLEGYGRNFAEAAWTYGVDPRWSPAISCIESSKGAKCFKPYNAWGWGADLGDSWEESIDAHVAGLARAYGSTISLSAAKKYCPPTYVDWYNKVLAQMKTI